MNPLINPITAIVAVLVTALAILVIRTNWHAETADLRNLFKKEGRR